MEQHIVISRIRYYKRQIAALKSKSACYSRMSAGNEANMRGIERLINECHVKIEAKIGLIYLLESGDLANYSDRENFADVR